MRIKICGITNPEDAQLAVAKGSDAIGFIFYPKSKRYIEPEAALAIAKQLPAFVVKVGVFVDEKLENVNNIAKQVGLNSVQLHGNETLEYAKQVNVPVIKAFRIDDNFNFSKLDEFSDFPILLDAFSGNEFGGTGLKFDWNKIPDAYKQRIILAGGISADNVEHISKTINPQAIDVSSSVELSPGIKDHEKLRKLLRQVNRLRSDL